MAMGDTYFVSLLLAAGVCGAFAMYGAALWHQTRNRQFADLFALSVLEAVYCGVTYRYLRETSSEAALPIGQSICAFTPYITYFFGSLVLSFTSSMPAWLRRFQRVNFALTSAFALSVVLDMRYGLGLTILPRLETDLASAHRHRLLLTALGQSYLGFVSVAFTLFSVLLFRAYRTKPDLLPMVIGCVIYFVATIVDFGILTKLRDGYFVQHFGFFALVVSAWRVLAGRFERSVQVLEGAVARLAEERRQLLFAAPTPRRQSLEGLGALAAAIAHEVNNPVQGIINYATVLRRKVVDRPSELDLVDKIERESERVTRVMHSLLYFGRAQREAPSEESVAQLVQSVVTLTETAILREGIAFSVRCAADLPRLPCRPQQLQHVLFQLVTNARDAVHARSPQRADPKAIEIRAERIERAGEPWLRIAVHDSGDGVDPNLVDRIFDPFFTTKSADGGTGLGLSVSAGIVEAHGGALRLLNQVGLGAVFMAELPCTPARLDARGGAAGDGLSRMG
jgi:signal transduction histidine kinase